jgi:iron(III) transport system substrate-binding protein
MRLILRSCLVSWGLICAAFAQANTNTTESLVVYSARNEQLIKPLFDAYTQETGVKIEYLTDKEGPLLQKLKAEGARTPADILMTVDAGNLWQAKKEKLLTPIDSVILNQNIPAHLKDTDNQWFGLSVRARTIVYNTQKVNPKTLSTYEDLANPQYKGKLCLRSSKKVYNQSLVAMMIDADGPERTLNTIKGWVANLATPPLEDDTKALKAVASGLCDITLVNTYYFGRLIEKEPNLPLAIFWPNQADKIKNLGVHVNVSGAGIVKFSKKKAQAQKLIEWLSSDKAQNLYADSNLEYPANPKVKAAAIVDTWGTFKQSPRSLTIAGKNQRQAVMLMDKAGYR